MSCRDVLPPRVSPLPQPRQSCTHPAGPEPSLYLLPQTDLDEAEMAQIQAKLGDLLKYMQKQQSTLFLSEYARVQPAAAGGAAASSSSSSAGAAPAPVGAT